MNDIPTPNNVKFASKPVPPKKEFTRKPHLTQRPFVNHDLAQLRNELAQGNKNGGKR